MSKHMLSHKNHETPHKAPHNNHANLHQQAVLPQPITTYKFTFSFGSEGYCYC
jgi:hypothetical protein